MSTKDKIFFSILIPYALVVLYITFVDFLRLNNQYNEHKSDNIPGIVIVEMTNYQDATRFKTALELLKRHSDEGGGVQLMIYHNGMTKSCGFVGQDIKIKEIRVTKE